MIGILLVTHGEFGEEIKRSAELIIGPISNCLAISLNRDDSISNLKDQVEQSLESLNQGEGVIVLVDLVGGSPFNVCSVTLKQRRDFKLLSGLNLSMIVECAMMRESLGLDELTQQCKQTGINSVIEVNP
ncbi:PTS sugar transporter subunit IIA [Candidatus Enterococcus ferrettii]|uniref:PTS system, mannose-specific IIA component n=1 Tax=Candidatus Enterococcus ferrettii TaxID=2815324 RepID=A0ABV0ES40_9ENTE|nr:PTS sugar transporter subunit IIA [Enterococcus sp. 665A]MBO1339297.1 PTS sugar transporter subunit IIA [Enterococcus sp. 665A]